MVHIERKKKKGRIYLYLAIRARINGKVRRVWQKYLGPEESFMEKASKMKLQLDNQYEIKTLHYGLPVALYQIAQRLKLVEIIDQLVPKRDQGLSVGEYLLIATLNRCVSPMSKTRLPDWFQKTYLKELFGPTGSTESTGTYLDARAYVNHFDYLTQEAIEKIEFLLNKQLLQEFDIKMDQLFYDPTNFFTYINPKDSNDQTLPRHGKSKEGKYNLNIVGLSLVCSGDGSIPLMHQVYPGNIQDATHFKTQHQNILNRIEKLGLNASELTLIFDKGNISKEAFEGIDASNIKYICSVRPSSHKNLNQLLDEEFPMFILPNDKEIGIKEYQREMHGKVRRLIVCYNPLKQHWNAINKLKKVKANLQAVDDWFDGNDQAGKVRLNRHKWRSVTNVEKKIKELLSKKYLHYFDYNVEEIDGKIRYQISLKQETLDEDLAKLGKTFFMTNRDDEKAEELIWLYRKQFTVEKAFSNLKHPEWIRVRPMHHYKDSSIRGHIFSCVVALLLISLLHREVRQVMPSMGQKDLFEQLNDIQVAEIHFSEKDITHKMVYNSTEARKLAKILQLESLLKISKK